MSDFKKDILIFGGGIAGLWLLNSLKKQGYNVALIEKNTLGGAQTLASQGMIHGGQKYILTGNISNHAVNVAEMPAVWASCFQGKGDIDLSKVKTLSDEQIMWSSGNMASNLTVFMAAKAVNGNTIKLDKNNVPDVLKLGDGFKGKAYKLSESVLDAKNLIENLASNQEQDIYKGELTELIKSGNNSDKAIIKDGNGNLHEVSANLFIFTSGQGNEEFAKMIGLNKTEITQRRPLKQIMIKDMNYPLYGHCITANPKPRVTITAHPIENNKYIWYLGGNIAEKSVSLGNIDAIKFAKSEMMDIFPEINWDNKEWSVLEINRAEPNQDNGRLPEGSHFEAFENNIIAWPSKLTFTPSLATKINKWLDDNDYKPSGEQTKLELPHAEIGLYPWEDAEWIKI